MRILVGSALVLVLLAGCFAPSKTATRAISKVEASKKEIDKVDDRVIQHAAASAFGTQKALEAAPASPQVDAARKFNDRVRLTIGEPQVRDALEVERIVQGLLDEDRRSREIAEAKLRQRDAEVVGLQDRITKLEGQLTKREADRDETFLDISALADRFVRIRAIFRWAIVLVLVLVFGPLLFRVLGILVPVTGPFAEIFASIFAKAGGTILKAAPLAAQKAGYVASEQFAKTQEALEDVVLAVQRLREDADIEKKIDPILRDATDRRTSRPVIKEVKQRLKLA